MKANLVVGNKKGGELDRTVHLLHTIIPAVSNRTFLIVGQSRLVCSRTSSSSSSSSSSVGSGL